MVSGENHGRKDGKETMQKLSLQILGFSIRSSFGEFEQPFQGLWLGGSVLGFRVGLRVSGRGFPAEVYRFVVPGWVMFLLTDVAAAGSTF